MLIAKGTAVMVKLVGERGRRALPGAMLHDPTGRAWPKCSLLVTSFKKTDAPVDDGDASDYFGRRYEQRKGEVVLPPKALGEWTEVGQVEKLFYVRGGLSHPGGYFHDVGKRTLWNLFRSGKATLYKHGRVHRIELSKGCVADSRGVVYP